MTGTIQALVGCQDIDCATEVSLHLDMVRMLNGEPICETCNGKKPYAKLDDDGVPEIDWGDLPPVTLADLCE